MPIPAREIVLADAEATARLGERLADLLQPGDLVLLKGPIGAGKSLLARAAILSLLAEDGRREDVPSPTFTLVQSYDTARGEVIHADLYRLSDPRDLDDIGLTDALGQAICLIEWPEMLDLSDGIPRLEIALSPEVSPRGEGRRAVLTALGERWRDALDPLVGEAA